MKKIIIFIIIVLFGVSYAISPFAVAHAVDIPYIIISGEVWLLDITTGNRIFVLPETYYARIDNLDSNYYYVTFNGVSGKVEKVTVSTVGYHTTATGTIQDIQIAEKYHTFTEIKIKTAMDGGGTDIEVPTSESLIFLGKYPSTDMWYYVKYNESCGYIRAEFTNQPNMVISKFIPEEKPKSDENGNNPNGNSKTKLNPDLIKILIISGLCFVLIIIIILIFRPNKNRKNRYYYEE